MILQPIVENALYHGIKNKRGGGRIVIRGYEDGEGVAFEIQDNGIGMDGRALEAWEPASEFSWQASRTRIVKNHKLF